MTAHIAPSSHVRMRGRCELPSPHDDAADVVRSIFVAQLCKADFAVHR